MSSQHSHSIKRKPPPTIDTRYPLPDPTDPFAPLWVLRSRASISAFESESTDSSKPSFKPYPPFFNKNVLEKANNYRRRSQSTPITLASPPIVTSHAYAFPVGIGSYTVPCSYIDTITDSSSGIDVEANMISILPGTHRPPIPGATAKMTRLFLPRKRRSSLATTESPPRAKGSLSKQVQKHSISSPTHFRHLSLTRRMGFQSSHSVSECNQEAPLRRFVTSDAPSPSIERRRYHSQTESQHKHNHSTAFPLIPHPTELPNGRIPATPLSSSYSTSTSSSYVHIFPSDIPTSTSDNTLPPIRTAPRSTLTSSATFPVLCSHVQRPRGNRHLSSHDERKRPPLFPTQTEWAIPTQSQLAHAASLPIITESGLYVNFGSLFEAQRTIVIFIRYFWCPFCQDYMSSLTSLAHSDMMADNGKEKEESAQLVVISNSTHAFIAKYKQLFNMPFSMYTDPSLALYSALGMGREGERNVAGVPPIINTQERVVGEEKARVLDGGYVRHGFMSGIAMVVMRAIKVRMPVWENGGDVHQLGGEFVLGPGLTCTYAHRMQSTKGHAPIRDVLEVVGVHVPLPLLETSPSSTANMIKGWEARREKTKKRLSSMKKLGAGPAWRKQNIDVSVEGSRSAFGCSTSEGEAELMMERTRSFEQLREKKSIRRGTFLAQCDLRYDPDGIGLCLPVTETEEEPGEASVIPFEDGRPQETD